MTKMPGRFLSRLGIFTPSILMHQLPEFLRGGVGAVELLLAFVVEVDILAVHVHISGGGLAVAVQFQQVVRIVCKQGELLVQRLGVLQHLVEALQALGLLGGAGV